MIMNGVKKVELGLRGCDSRAKQHGMSYACGMGSLIVIAPRSLQGCSKPAADLHTEYVEQMVVS